MSPFRLFGQPPAPEPAAPSREGVTWAPGAWDGDPAPATRHSRPVALERFPDGADDDPPTDPHGFPPIPAQAAWTAPPQARPGPDRLEAAALAGAFAADYLSWDEDDHERRGRALADHLAWPVDDPALLGWDGRGRQRADFALPGLVRPDGDDRVLVDVRVRVTPYREIGDRAADRAAQAGESELDVLGTPAAAPAPTGRGWRGCASFWVRLSVPVVRDHGRLGVDAAEEADALAGEHRPDPALPVVGDAGAQVHALPAPDVRPVRPAAEPESAW